MLPERSYQDNNYLDLKVLYSRVSQTKPITIFILGLKHVKALTKLCSDLQRGVSEIIRAPSYDTALYDGDVALLRLDSPVVLNRRIRPVCVPDEDTFSLDDYSAYYLPEDTEAIAVGWGTSQPLLSFRPNYVRV